MITHSVYIATPLQQYINIVLQKGEEVNQLYIFLNRHALLEVNMGASFFWWTS